MAVTRLRSKTRPSSKSGTPQKLKRSTPSGTPVKLKGTPSKSPKLKETVEEVEVEEEEVFELPSDSDSESGSDDEADVLELEDSSESEDDEAKSAKEEFKSKKEQIEKDIKKIMSHEVKTSLANAKGSNKNDSKKKKSKTGIIYIGRLPRGFEEYELKKYFEQFGSILNLRVSRNKKTGNSKHYAFIEFENYEVAKIAQETMNNYLIFGHIVKVSLLSKEQHLHVELFKNANVKFKRIPWMKISKTQNDKPKKLEKLQELQKRSENKKAKKLLKLKELGINYSL